MKKKKRILSLALIIALLAIAVVGGTMAYFTDITDTKTNSFTIGKVDITLDEDKWTDYSKMMPGTSIDKNPTITVNADSEDAWVFLEVRLSPDFVAMLTNYGLANPTLTQKDIIGKWFHSNIPNGPKIMEMGTDYVILGVGSAKTAGDKVEFFDAVTVPTDLTSGMFDPKGTYTIDVKAYAIQAENLSTRPEAYKALFGRDPQF